MVSVVIAILAFSVGFFGGCVWHAHWSLANRRPDNVIPFPTSQTGENHG